MADENMDPEIAKAKIIDNMGIVQEYTTARIARSVGLPEEETREYLEELADGNRVRKRDSGNTTKWVRFN